MAFIKKHKVGLIILAVIFLLCGGGFFACSKAIKQATEMTMAMLSSSTEEASTMDITETLSTSGKVVSCDKVEVIINGAYSGVEIKELHFEEGDFVKEGDVLAVMDKEALETNLEIAKKREKAAKITAANDSRSIENENKNYEQKLKDIDDNIDRLWRTYENAVQYYEGRQRAMLQTQLNAADAYDGLNNDGSRSDYKTFAQQQDNLINAQNAVDNAYKDMLDARDKYDEAVSKRASDIEALENTHKNTLSNYNSSLTTYAANKISTEDGIATLEEQLEDGEVKAPISGVVTYVNYKQGDKYNGYPAPQPLLVIEDTSSYEIETYVDEYDIPKLKVGQKVSIKSNGTGDAVMDGEIKHINTRATTGNAVGAGLAKYSVKISVKNPDPNLRLDMTAKLTITINEKKDVLGVPYNAIQKDDDGKKFIEVVDEVATEEAKAAKSKDVIDPTVYNKIYVETGIENDYYVEVISDQVASGAKVKIITGNGAGSLETLMEQMGMMGGM